MDTDEAVGLDYEGMYAQLTHKKRDYKEQVHSVIVSCVILEALVGQLVRIRVDQLGSPRLRRWLKNPNLSISSKMRMLRIAGLIGEDLYEDLCLLFGIRNRFAHRLLFGARMAKAEFKPLKEVRMPNAFVRGLPNTSVKFQLVMSYCFTQLVRISSKLDPSSVLELEVDEITPLEDYESNG